jgi:hypothetical protein
MATNSNYGISRINHGKAGTPAWRVCLYRGQEKAVEKEFPFLKHGGEQQARKAAEAFRNEALLLFPPEKSSEVRQRLRENNTSGFPGVSRQTMGHYTYWIAQTKTRDGKKLSKAYRIELYGEQQALTLAIEARKQQLKTIEHRVFRSADGERLFSELSS